MSSAILWLTGLSGSGKTTLAREVRERVSRVMPAEVLDGDEMRRQLSTDLGFTKPDRDTNIRRIGVVARLLAGHGVFTITAAISPYADTRNEMRRAADAQGILFLEVFIDAALQTLIERDTKGLYRRALAGEIDHFTGISDPYEPPLEPELVVTTDRESVAESVAKIMDLLASRRVVPRALVAG